MTDEIIPATWTRICGLSLDRHTVGAVWLGHDRKAKVMTVYDEYSVALPALPVLADAINVRCGKTAESPAWIPVIMDIRAFKRTEQQGATLGGRLADLGVNLNDARYDEEAGVADVYRALQIHKLTVEPTCRRWQAEFDTFGRNDKGELPPGFHLMRATGLCLMVEPSEWISENRAESDRRGYDPGEQGRNKVTGY